MQIHTFRAESLQAALQQVRRQLGPDAAILQTREKRQGRLGIFAKPVIEVEATLGPSNSAAEEHEPRPTTTESDQSASPVRLTSAPPRATQQLASQQVASQRSLAQQLPVEQQPENRLSAGRLKVSGAINLSVDKPHVVALVGPTGSGKSTSLAKIASGFCFEMGCRVGLIALDTFRFGAVDQLLQYADMLSAPLEVVSSAEQVPAAIKRLSNCDLVLIDTAGRAPRDTVHLADLQKFLQLARPHSVQLVVSASSSTAHVSQTVECFSVLKPTDLLITKLDEAVDFGSWLTLLECMPLPVSYLTHGQRVPQDIIPATADCLASLLLAQQQNFEQQDFQQQAFPSEDFQRAQSELQLSN